MKTRIHHGHLHKNLNPRASGCAVQLGCVPMESCRRIHEIDQCHTVVINGIFFLGKCIRYVRSSRRKRQRHSWHPRIFKQLTELYL